jgi:hypothetical protein
VLLRSLGFGEPDPAIFGIGETAAVDHVAGGLPGWSQDGVPGGDAALHPGGLDEHEMAVDITGGEDVPDVGTQVVIGGNRTGLGPDAGRVQVQLAEVGGPADGSPEVLEDGRDLAAGVGACGGAFAACSMFRLSTASMRACMGQTTGI